MLLEDFPLLIQRQRYLSSRTCPIFGFLSPHSTSVRKALRWSLDLTDFVGNMELLKGHSALKWLAAVISRQLMDVLNSLVSELRHLSVSRAMAYDVQTRGSLGNRLSE